MSNGLRLRTRGVSAAWTPEDVADELLSRRDELLRMLPRRIKAAGLLRDEQRELVVDDAATFVSVEYERSIGSSKEAERVFWRAAELRVLQMLDRRRRNDTVRGRFEREGLEALKEMPAGGVVDPAAIVEATTEHAMAAEFAATLDPVENAVLRRKWLIDPATPLPRGHTGSEPLGWRTIAEQLDMPARQVRAAERSIEAKLDRFAALVAAGRLCQQRATDLEAVSAGVADALQSNLAHAHLEHCVTCKADFVGQLRAVRSAEFARKVAALLPPAPLADSTVNHGRLRELVADWGSRLLGHGDAASAAAQASAAGVGRGAGGVLVVKVAAILAGGAATIGAATGVFDRPAPAPAPTRHAADSPTPTPSAAPSATPTPNVKAALAAARQAAERRRRAARKSNTSNTPTSHESERPSSPAPSGSQANGASEFTPDSSNLPSGGPAPAASAPGASEFP